METTTETLVPASSSLSEEVTPIEDTNVNDTPIPPHPMPPPSLEPTVTDPEDDGDVDEPDLTLTREQRERQRVVAASDMKERDFAQPPSGIEERRVTFNNMDGPPLMLIDNLVDMGFHRAKAVTSLNMTGGKSVDAAVSWLFENDPTPMEAPLPGDPLYASPIGSGSVDESNLTNREFVSHLLDGGSYQQGRGPDEPALPASHSAIGGGGVVGDPPPPARAPSPVDHSFKMVFVVRRDLDMGKGKIAAQCAHGAVELTLRAQSNPEVLTDFRMWLEYGATKIVLRADNERELIDLQKYAEQRDIPVYVVHDAGRTQVAPGSKTVLALGPVASSRIDPLTGALKLL